MSQSSKMAFLGILGLLALLSDDQFMMRTSKLLTNVLHLYPGPDYKFSNIEGFCLPETHSRRFYHCEMQLYTVNVRYLTRKQQDSMLTSSGKSPSGLLWIKKHALGHSYHVGSASWEWNIFP
ncbi:unnamed protein product [Sphagnum balticum]